MKSCIGRRANAIAKENRIAENLAEQKTYEMLRAAIIDGRLPPNYHMVESDLAEALKVSRQTVRMALRLLARDRLVRIIPHRGAFVSVPTKDEVLAAFAVRIPLEGMAARLAAVHHTSEEIHQMQQILRREEEAYRLKRRDEAYKLSGEFHEQIAKASRNEFLHRFVRELLAYVDSCLILFDPFKAQPPHSPRAHAQILQMVEARDAEGAERAMVEHIVHTQQRLDFSKVKPAGNLRDVLAGSDN